MLAMRRVGPRILVAMVVGPPVVLCPGRGQEKGKGDGDRQDAIFFGNHILSVDLGLTPISNHSGCRN